MIVAVPLTKLALAYYMVLSTNGCSARRVDVLRRKLSAGYIRVQLRTISSIIPL
jgi:hypothetical protein